jgi:fused signal recognition particle receptor
MFGSLKKKLKKSIRVFSRKVERAPEKAVDAPKDEEIPKIVPGSGKKVEKGGILRRVRKRVIEKKLSASDLESIFEPLELSLLESGVAFEVVARVREELESRMVDKPIKRGKTETVVNKALENAFVSVLMKPKVPSFKKKPTVIMFVGVNGAGKTTSLAKFCNWLKKRKKSCVLAASDTFRAASIEQLEKHAAKLGVKVIKHDYGSDAAAVAYDAVEHARSKGIDVVLIDTAGRSHANVNLMDELKKIKRVAKPDYIFFVGDALVGNDAVEQAESFNEAVGIDFSMLAKADVDQKGGAILSIAYVTKKPILFLGTGQGYNDLEVFDKDKILKRMF